MFRCYARLFTFITVALAAVEARSCNCQDNSVDPSQTTDRLNDIEANPIDRPTQKRKKCCPYNFDGKMCRVVGDRVLCGYNRNVGPPADGNEISDLKNGCRINGNRVECNYVQGPFDSSRSPPVENTPDNDNVTPDSVTPPGDVLIETSPTTPACNHETTTCQNIRENIICKRTIS